MGEYRTGEPGALLKRWTKVTGELDWGVQRAFLNALQLVADEKVHMVYGANYRDGKPCLVNSVAQMLTHSAAGVTPTAFAGAVVNTFDSINSEFEQLGVNNEPGYLSPLAADILIQNFGKLKTVEEVAVPVEKEVTTEPYVEPTDEELAAKWLAAMQAPAPEAVDDLARLGDPTSQHLKSLRDSEALGK